METKQKETCRYADTGQLVPGDGFFHDPEKVAIPEPEPVATRPVSLQGVHDNIARQREAQKEHDREEKVKQVTRKAKAMGAEKLRDADQYDRDLVTQSSEILYNIDKAFSAQQVVAFRAGLEILLNEVLDSDQK